MKRRSKAQEVINKKNRRDSSRYEGKEGVGICRRGTGEVPDRPTNGITVGEV